MEQRKEGAGKAECDIGELRTMKVLIKRRLEMEVEAVEMDMEIY